MTFLYQAIIGAGALLFCCICSTFFCYYFGKRNAEKKFKTTSVNMTAEMIVTPNGGPQYMETSAQSPPISPSPDTLDKQIDFGVITPDLDDSKYQESDHSDDDNEDAAITKGDVNIVVTTAGADNEGNGTDEDLFDGRKGSVYTPGDAIGNDDMVLETPQ